MAAPGAWRRCSSCKSDIGFGTIYQVCSVSTCNRKRTGLVFCSYSCWDVHLPIARHREAWAVEATSPSSAAADTPTARSNTPASPPQDAPRDVLIVASKLKAYVKARSGMNTSDRVLSVLSDRVRTLCDAAIRSAREAERKTLLDRDF